MKKNYKIEFSKKAAKFFKRPASSTTIKTCESD